IFVQTLTLALERVQRDPSAVLAIDPSLPHPSLEKHTSFNLVFTRDWLMVVPRRAEHCVHDGLRLSVNSVGMAGFLLAKSPQEVELIKTLGPLEVLNRVAFL
ncbi:bifunctional AP-4-A phosphorylase/ADP sulfurylase, partial [Kappamyces sp. JEL0680]